MEEDFRSAIIYHHHKLWTYSKNIVYRYKNNKDIPLPAFYMIYYLKKSLYYR